MPEVSQASPRGDGMLATVDRLVARVEDAFNFIAAAVIFLLMFFMVAEVIGRRLLNAPIPGAIDWIEVSMAAFAFLGAAYCQRLGGHIRMELVISNFRGALLWAVEALATAVAIFYVFVVMRRSFFHFLRAWEIGDSTIDVQLPVWPSKLIVPVALALLLVRLLIQFWGYLRLVVQPAAAPIAVPLIASTAEHARGEIEEAFHDAPGGPAVEPPSRGA